MLSTITRIVYNRTKSHDRKMVKGHKRRIKKEMFDQQKHKKPIKRGRSLQGS